MGYFNYHGTIKKMIKNGKLTGYCFTENYNGIKPALVLFFDDDKRPIMPIRKERWEEYADILDSIKKP